MLLNACAGAVGEGLLRAEGDCRRAFPVTGASLAVSGRRIPPLVFAAAAVFWMRRRSPGEIGKGTSEKGGCGNGRRERKGPAIMCGELSQARGGATCSDIQTHRTA